MDFSVSSDIVAELLEVAINLILYTREIYPQSVFQRRKKYNIPVQMCIHPGVSSYISSSVGAIVPVLEKGEVDKVVVAVLGEDKRPLEKFVFDIDQLPTKPQNIKEDPSLQRLEEALRAFCLKLSISDSLLKPLPGGTQCTFAIHLHVPENVSNDLTVEQDCHWIPAEAEQVEVPDAQIVPLKTLRTQVCNMQLYVEESSAKV